MPRQPWPIWVLVGMAMSGQPSAGQDLQTGAARIDITPTLGGPLWGYAARRDLPSTGVRDPLLARALVLEAGKTRLALVSLDLGRAPTRKSFEAIRQTVQKSVGVNHLFLVASHTHHGPVLELEDWPEPGKPYRRTLEEKICQVIQEAAKELKPARLGIAAKEVSWNRNRHSRLPDKPVDRELLVVKVEDLQGKTLATVVNFAAHPTLLDAKGREFSADFPGPLAQLVEKETGAPCLFLQGAAGDLSPNPGNETGTDRFGLALGKEVISLGKMIQPGVSGSVPLQVREREFRFPARVDLGNPLVRTVFSQVFFRELVEFYEREYREGIRPRLITAMVGDRIGLVGISGELFSGHALALKKRARLEHLLVLGYCNDYHQYFPTIEAVAEGGYGTEPPVSPVVAGAGERMMNRALLDLFEMRGKDFGTTAD